MNKLKSFTLLEMMIALILTSIVVSMSYMCYKIVLKQVVGYKNISDTLSGISQLHTILQSDFYLSDFVRKDQDKMIFIFSANSAVKYHFKESLILRETGNTVDTFFIAALNLQRKIQQGEQAREHGLVDECSFKAKLLNEDESFHYIKTYSASDLIADEKNDLR